MKSLTTGQWIGIIIGTAIVAAGLYWAGTLYLPWRDAIQTQGVVTAVLTEEDEDGNLYRAMISYQNQSGDSLGFKSLSAYSTPHFSVGEKVDVLYLPNNRAILDRFRDRWLGPLFVIGLGVFVLSLVYLISRIKT